MTSGDPDARSGSRSHSHAGRHATPREFARVYRSVLDYQAESAAGTSGTTLRTTLSANQMRRYADAILAAARAHGTKAMTPAVLLTAAERTIEHAAKGSIARVGLQPGTFDPIHYGHITMALAASIEARLQRVLLCVGGDVPDKPLVSPFAHRLQMSVLAVGDAVAKGVLDVTAIRQVVGDMFSTRADLLALAGDTPEQRRRSSDLAAFAWLIRANPSVTWTYIVGSDKVRRYGPNDERALVAMLGDARINARILYFPRPGSDVDQASDIAPYDWMVSAWDRTSISKASLPTCDLGASTIRRQLSTSARDLTSLSSWVPDQVLEHIVGSDDLLSRYRQAAISLARLQPSPRRAAFGS